MAATAAWAGPTSAAPALATTGVHSFALASTSAVAADDVWAVGTRVIQGSPIAVVEHWNGDSWQDVHIPVPGTSSNLSAVDAVAADDVWAVGVYSADGFETFAPLAEHWDGTTWTAVAVPDRHGAMGNLQGVSGTSATDVWATGIEYASGNEFALTEHWDGTSWSVLPQPPDAVSLPGVDAVTPTNVWAVGNYALEHWNGTTWTNTSTYPAVIIDVLAVNAHDAWVVGWKGRLAYTRHWDGTSWTDVPTAPFAVGRNQLYAISGSASNDVWAVGSRRYHGVWRSLAEHWDGSTWTAVHAPGSKTSPSELRDVSTLASGPAWAVGHVGNRGLTASWDGGAWTRVPIS